uniref:Uncharacterized protein n=1 Tax=Kwoniella bestiolae CBS 10118 TaxID=1296100 RepID=A0A1B9G6D4_9TREE|nr:hypothetical protein I302_04272 [Kwoniella bestiolae CBS 10118]OCF26586.1 hypothetical protein I302_04272 [Kwoniella bestiolae CBS 10118]
MVPTSGRNSSGVLASFHGHNGTYNDASLNRGLRYTERSKVNTKPRRPTVVWNLSRDPDVVDKFRYAISVADCLNTARNLKSVDSAHRFCQEMAKQDRNQTYVDHTPSESPYNTGKTDLNTYDKNQES